jgi:hypothetical protein
MTQVTERHYLSHPRLRETAERFGFHFGPARREISEFLHALFDDLPGFVELRAIDVKAKQSVDHAFLGDHEQVIDWIGQSDRRSIEEFVNIYIGVATRCDKSGGTRSNLRATRAVWADLDCVNVHHTVTRKLIAEFALPPSLWVVSGAGFHLYWLLKEELDLRKPNAIDLLEQVNRRLATELGGNLSAVGAHRMLRPPRTQYRPLRPKRVRGFWPREVECEGFFPYRKYALGDFVADRGGTVRE